MFDSIRLLCINGAHEDQCRHATIVTSDKYLKIANSLYTCPGCGRTAKMVQPFFLQMQTTEKAANRLLGCGLKLKSYDFAVKDAHIDDYVFIPDYVWEPERCWDWNFQISHYAILDLMTGRELPIWENAFINKGARYIPKDWRKNTANKVLLRDRLFIGTNELRPVQVECVKAFASAVRRYNKLWVELADDLLSAVPLDTEFLPDLCQLEIAGEISFYQ
jgi:hypothetical protein